MCRARSNKLINGPKRKKMALKRILDPSSSAMPMKIGSFKLLGMVVACSCGGGMNYHDWSDKVLRELYVLG